MERLNRLEPEFCTNIPAFNDMRQGVLYVSEEYETTSHLCCCGCKELVVLPFSPPVGWSYTRVGDKVTMSPSIGNWNFRCKSHYFIRENRVEWC